MRFAPRAAALAAVTLVLAAPAAGAHAQGNHWTTVAHLDGGKVEACKKATTPSGPWLIKLRVDSRKATERLAGSAYVAKNAKNVDHWRSGWVAKGHLSSVGTVRLPRGSAYTFSAGIETGQSGTGASVKPGRLATC
jgi:hypothetical protein